MWQDTLGNFIDVAMQVNFQLYNTHNNLMELLRHVRAISLSVMEHTVCIFEYFLRRGRIIP
jgi:hypothetical protein